MPDRKVSVRQARSSVTKPSYAWHQLKLHSFLLGALSVRQPISLNRLKAAGDCMAVSAVKHLQDRLYGSLGVN